MAVGSPDSDSTYAAREDCPCSLPRPACVANVSSKDLLREFRTEDLILGLDGTPIQLLPKSLAPANTCSYRWWPAALH